MISWSCIILIISLNSLLGFAAQLTSPDPWHSTYGNVNQWCGKAYEPGDPAIPPTGWLDPPVLSPVPLLDLKVLQRYSPYLEEDAEGVFVIDTSLSYIHGQAWSSSSSSVDTARRELSAVNSTAASNKGNLAVTITRADTGRLIARTTAPVNVSDTQVTFHWGDLVPSLTSYAIAVAATGPDGHTFTAKTSLQRLPSRTDGGSVVKIDNLYGGLMVQERGSKNWTPLFPFSFYFGSGLLEPKTTEVLTEWVNMGYNILHIIPPYDYNDYKKYAEEADKLGLWLMYDMRHTFNNHDELVKQIEMFKGFSNMLLWYTSDEPDGTQQPLDSTKNSYDTIKALDPYHPVSLVMNCENYHFEEYTSGADIILTDVYPVGVNTTWSTKFDTPVNTTYGCAGCDNCHCTDALPNLPHRLSTYRTYSTQLGLGTGLQKPLWAVPQAFGAEDHWARHPTADEEAAMVMLNVNHGVKGSVAWAWPPADEIQQVSTKLAKALTDPAVAALVLGAKMVKLTDCGMDEGKLDVTAWVAQDGGGMLVGWVNPGRAVLDVPSIDLAPALEVGMGVTGVKKVVWGKGGWTVSQSHSSLVQTGGGAAGLGALEVNMLVLDMAGGPGIVPVTGGPAVAGGGSGVTS